MRIGVIQKCPSKIDYAKLLGMNVEVLDMSSVKVSRLLVKNIDLEVTFSDYDWVILVGTEAVKRYSKQSSVGNFSGRHVKPNPKNGQGYDKFIACMSPAALHFKPEQRPAFDATVESIASLIRGDKVDKLPVKYTPIQDTEQAVAYLKDVLSRPLKDVPAIALDTETSALYARKGYVLGLSMSHRVQQGVYIDADYFDDECTELLQEIVDTPGRHIVGHNMKFDDHMIVYHLGVNFEKAHKEGRLHDTMVMHYVLDERQGTHGLKPLAIKFTDMGNYDEDLDDFKENYCKTHKVKKDDFTYDLIPFDVMWPYACGDTDATLRLFWKFYKIIFERDTSFKLKWLYENLLMPAIRFLGRMEDRGLPISLTRAQKANEHLHKTLAELEQKIYEFEEVHAFEAHQGGKFNPNSTAQLRVLLFDFVGLTPTGKLTDTGAISTDAEVLEKLGEEHPLPKLLLTIRQTGKLIGSFVTKMIDNIDRDGCLRTNFGATTTTSGRLSSSGTINAQQLPRDNPIIKGCIVAPPGYRVVAKDLTTAEVYYAAVLSGDRNLQQVFINMQADPEGSADFHSTIAHMVFKLPCLAVEVKKAYPAMRQASKAITFGILYGSGAASVADSINIALLEQSIETGEPFEPCTVAMAKEYQEQYFAQFPQLKRWIDASHDQIRQHGFIYSYFGRKRRLRNFRSSDKGIAAGEVRSGFNAIIQSASSDALLLGCIDADIELMDRELDARIVGLVHDSIIGIVREDLIDQYEEILDRNIQKDRFNGWDKKHLGIPNYPVGIEADSEDGGSGDYSCGKMEKTYPWIAVHDNKKFESFAVKIMKEITEGNVEYDAKREPKAHAILKHKEKVLTELQELGHFV